MGAALPRGAAGRAPPMRGGRMLAPSIAARTTPPLRTGMPPPKPRLAARRPAASRLLTPRQAGAPLPGSGQPPASAAWGKHGQSTPRARRHARGHACALRINASVSTGQMAQPGCPARHQASAAARCRRRAKSRCGPPSCPVSVASISAAPPPPASGPRFSSRPGARGGAVGGRGSCFALMNAASYHG